MIMSLNHVFTDKGNSDLLELRILIHQVLGGDSAKCRLINEQQLQKSYVFRLTWEINSAIRTIVAKRFHSDRSYVERLALKRWLVITNLSHLAPTLLGVAPERAGEYVWHVYEDLGNSSLDQEETACGTQAAKDRGFLSPLQASPGRDRIEVIIRLVCALHEKLQGHALLGECRHQSTDLGSHFLYASVSDAICALEFLDPANIALSQKQTEVRENLLDRLYKLRVQLPWRSSFLEKKGGPHTLLHGDLSVKNTFTAYTEHGLTGWLIDWDHVGVGPVSYDLSTFLMQIPINERLWTLDLYQQVRKEGNTCWPTYEEWNLLFETNEYARLANSVIWPAITAAESQSEWAFNELAKIDGWFKDIKPVLLIEKAD